MCLFPFRYVLNGNISINIYYIYIFHHQKYIYISLCTCYMYINIFTALTRPPWNNFLKLFSKLNCFNITVALPLQFSLYKGPCMRLTSWNIDISPVYFIQLSGYNSTTSVYISLEDLNMFIYIYIFRYNVDCAASTGLYGLAEGAFGTQVDI